MARLMHGRRQIFTDADEITDENVVEILQEVSMVHTVNADEIEYLYNYYKTNQPILARKKDVRPEICNKIVENRANEIVSFKVGYLMGEPVQYVNRTGKESATDGITRLNEFVFAEDKAAKDKELAEWFTICGTSYRLILPDVDGEMDESPFELYTLDPRGTFVIYQNDISKRALAGVTIVKRKDKTVYNVYTKSTYYEVVDGQVTKTEPHMLGSVPIIEYPANSARLGSFEIVLPLLDALNSIASNRMDGIEQFIQALMVFYGARVEKDQFEALREQGALLLPENADVKYLIEELNQSQTQTFVDHCYQTILTICGMPNRNGGSSTSDTGSAVIMRDGWSAAEARAKESELTFKRSEKEFLKIALRIANSYGKISLRLSDIDIRFTRRNYENIQEKSQVLTTMLSNDMIHPRLAFEHCGMFADPELAYTASMEWHEKNQSVPAAENPIITNGNKEVSDDGSGEKKVSGEI